MAVCDFSVVSILVVCFLAGVHCQETSGMSFIGTAIAGFNPCSDQFVGMVRESGRPPSKDNYWTGEFDLLKYKDIPEAIISMTLDSEAVVTVEGEKASVSADGKTFRFTTFGKVPPSLSFEVNAPANKPFPNIVSVTVNGLAVCKNPKPWYPYIQKVADTAVSAVAPSPNDSATWCGRDRIEHTDFVVKGQENNWPWHADIYQSTDKKKGKKYACAGSLISKNTVIAAGHCMTLNGQVIAHNLLSVVLGTNNILGRTQERELSNVIISPGVEKTPVKGDIAILHLAKEVEVNDYVQPICLWSDELSKDAIIGQKTTPEIISNATTKVDKKASRAVKSK